MTPTSLTESGPPEKPAPIDNRPRTTGLPAYRHHVRPWPERDVHDIPWRESPGIPGFKSLRDDAQRERPTDPGDEVAPTLQGSLVAGLQLADHEDPEGVFVNVEVFTWLADLDVPCCRLAPIGDYFITRPIPMAS